MTAAGLSGSGTSIMCLLLRFRSCRSRRPLGLKPTLHRAFLYFPRILSRIYLFRAGCVLCNTWPDVYGDDPSRPTIMAAITISGAGCLRLRGASAVQNGGSVCCPDEPCHRGFLRDGSRSEQFPGRSSGNPAAFGQPRMVYSKEAEPLISSLGSQAIGPMLVLMSFSPSRCGACLRSV